MSVSGTDRSRISEPVTSRYPWQAGPTADQAEASRPENARTPGPPHPGYAGNNYTWPEPGQGPGGSPAELAEADRRAEREADPRAVAARADAALDLVGRLADLAARELERAGI